MNEEKTAPILDLDELGSTFMIGKYHFTEGPDDSIEVVVPTVSVLPDITVSKVFAGTRYTVTGSYEGDIHLEDRISEILKRDMEV
jgi:hypothetical protein